MFIVTIVTIEKRQKPHRGGISGSMRSSYGAWWLCRSHCYKHAAPLGLKKVEDLPIRNRRYSRLEICATLYCRPRHGPLSIYNPFGITMANFELLN